MSGRRENWVDVAKGIAIVFVVLGHVVSSYHNSGLLKEAAAFNFIHTFAYSFHMPLFFALSGYLAAKQTHKGNKMARIRYKTLCLGIPYIVFSFFTWGMKFLLSSLSNSAVELGDLLAIPLFPLDFLWYIYTLLFIVVIHILLEERLSDEKGIAVALAGALAVRLALSVDNGLESIGLSGSVIETVGTHLIWYLLGVAGAVCWKPEVHLKTPVTAAGLVLYAVVIWWSSEAGFDGVFFELLIRAAGIVLFVNAAIHLEKSKTLAYLGKYSLPVYLLHGFVISACRIVMGKLRLPMLDGTVPILVCGVLGIAVPLLCYHICSRFAVLDFCFYPGKYLKRERY